MNKNFLPTKTIKHSFACALVLLAFSSAAFSEENLTAKQYFDRAVAESAKSEYTAAIFDYTKSLDVDPEYWNSYGNRSAAKYNSGDYQGALKDVDICIAHLPPMKSLNELKKKIEEKLTVSPEQAARIRAAQQMLLMAQFGGDMSSPAYMIMMQAQRIKAAREAQAALAGANAAPVAQSAPAEPANSARALSDRLSGMGEPGAASTVKQSHSVSVTKALPPTVHAPASQVAKVASAARSSESSTSQKLEELAMANASSQPATVSSVKSAAVSAPSSPAASTGGMTSQQYFDRACGKGHAMDLAGAIKDYDEAINLNPKYGEAYANRGSARFNTGDRAGALADFNAAVECMPGNAGVKAMRDRVASSQ